MDETRKQKIRRFYEDRRRMPSYGEIMALTGLSSRSSVFKLVRRLVAAGFLEKDRSGRLLAGVAWSGVPLLGLVEAGFPSPAEEDRGDRVSLDDYLIERKDASYMLRVKGDSMRDAGIVEGDMVIVERTNTARTGDIVIADVDGAWTMKYYRTKNGVPYLEAANVKYKPIYPKETLTIAAVVRGVVRKYS